MSDFNVIMSLPAILVDLANDRNISVNIGLGYGLLPDGPKP